MPDDAAREAPVDGPAALAPSAGVADGAGLAVAAGAGGDAARFASARMPSTPFWIALVLGVLAAVVFVLSAGALFVFGVGIVIAFFLVPVVNWLERRGWPRWLAAIGAVAVTLTTLVILLVASVAVLVEQGISFLRGLPTYLEALGEWYASLTLPDWLRASLDAAISALEDNLASIDQGAVVLGVAGSLVSLLDGLFAWFLLPFFLFYLLKDQRKMAGTFYARVPAPWKADVERILTITVGDFAQYFKAEFVVGSIMFVLVALGTAAIGMVTDSQLLVQYAILLGLIAFVMELIPQIGPILSYVPALILAIASGPEAIVLVSVFYFVVFNIEGSILVPTFQGRMVSFSGASVLVLIAIGFALAGIVGAILALPLAAVVRDLFRLFFDKAVEQDLIEAPGAVAGPTGESVVT